MKTFSTDLGSWESLGKQEEAGFQNNLAAIGRGEYGDLGQEKQMKGFCKCPVGSNRAAHRGVVGVEMDSGNRSVP